MNTRNIPGPLTIKPVSGEELALQHFAVKVNSGGRLTQAELNMSIVAAAAREADRYGPTPKEMELKPEPLPESVKGLLAEFSS